AKLYGFGNTASRQIKAARQQNDQAGGIHTLFLNQTPNTGSESVTFGSLSLSALSTTRRFQTDNIGRST
ncbi:MAG: hypothetical protein V8Q76_11655, partial [Bacteroides intestinalis]